MPFLTPIGLGIHRLQSVASKGERIRFVRDVEKFVKNDPNYTQVARLDFVVFVSAVVDSDLGFCWLASRFLPRRMIPHIVQSKLLNPAFCASSTSGS